MLVTQMYFISLYLLLSPSSFLPQGGGQEGALPLLFQCALNRVEALAGDGDDVAWTFVYWIYRLMDGDTQRVPVGKMPVLGAWHNLKRTIDGDRNHW